LERKRIGEGENMKVTVRESAMIFRKEFDGRATYSTGLSKKNQDGSYDNAYIGIQFKKDVNLHDKTKINITNGWLTHYKNKEGKPVFYIMCTEFTTEEAEQSGFTELEEGSPF
jgi:hypothetical protein